MFIERTLMIPPCFEQKILKFEKAHSHAEIPTDWVVLMPKRDDEESMRLKLLYYHVLNQDRFKAHVRSIL